jgi:hypothetical protein
VEVWSDVEGSWFGGGKEKREQPSEAAPEPRPKRKGSRPQR